MKRRRNGFGTRVRQIGTGLAGGAPPLGRRGSRSGSGFLLRLLWVGTIDMKIVGILIHFGSLICRAVIHRTRFVHAVLHRPWLRPVLTLGL